MGIAAFITQLVTWAAVLASPIDAGMLGLAFATIVFSALANFLLDRV